MLSKILSFSLFPKYEEHDWVIFPSKPNQLYSVYSWWYQMGYFHSYNIFPIGMEDFDFFDKEPKSIGVNQSEITLAPLIVVVKFFDEMISNNFGSLRAGEPWTVIENNILLTLMPYLTEQNNDKDPVYEAQQVFKRKFSAIKKQYTKLMKEKQCKA